MSNDIKRLGKGLKKLYIAQTVSMIGDSFTDLAITWFILQTGNVVQMGTNFALIFLPEILFAPILGNIVDNLSRKKLMWITDLLRMALDAVLIIFILRSRFSIHLIYAFTFVKSTLRLIYTPAQMAVIQQLTDEKQRVKANAWQQVSFNIALIAGPIFAGFLVALLPMGYVIALDGLTFLISAALIYVTVVEEKHLHKKQHTAPYFQQITDGFSYVNKNRWILVLSLAYAFLNGGNSLVNLAEPYLISDVLNLGSEALGIITAAASAGALAASLVLTKLRLKKHKLNYVFIAILIWGLGVLTLSIWSKFWMVIITVFVLYSMGPVMGVSSNAFYQNQVPSEFMGRVYAVRSMVSIVSMPIGFVFGISTVKFLGVRSTYLIAGAIICMGAFMALWAKSIHQKTKK